MKTIFLLLLSVSLVFGDSFREWTQLASGKTITAKMLEKSEDGKSVRIVMNSGKSHWVKAASLVTEDRDYILTWGIPVVVEFKHLEVTDSEKPAKRAGFKVIHVIARAKDEPLIVEVSEYKGHTQPKSRRITPKKTVEFDAEVQENYVVAITDEKRVCIEYTNERTRLSK